MADRPRRAGGRAARVALRAAKLEADRRPVQPGTSGGAYQPLTEAELQRVFDTALDLLENIGMGNPIPEFIEVVTEAGGHVDDAGRLRYPKGAVERAIETASKSWVWHGLDEDRSIEISDRRVHFGTAGAAVMMLDHSTQRFRDSTAPDLYDLARLVDTLDNIHFFCRSVVTRDIQDVRTLDITTAYASMRGTTKPVGTSFFQPANVLPSKSVVPKGAPAALEASVRSFFETQQQPAMP